MKNPVRDWNQGLSLHDLSGWEEEPQQQGHLLPSLPESQPPGILWKLSSGRLFTHQDSLAGTGSPSMMWLPWYRQENTHGMA